MKKIIILIMILTVGLFGICNSWAADLVCDPQTGVVSYDVIIDGQIESVDYPAEADGSIKYNIDFYADHQIHTFILIAIDASGWRSSASDPFDARKPDTVIGVKIIN